MLQLRLGRACFQHYRNGVFLQGTAIEWFSVRTKDFQILQNFKSNVPRRGTSFNACGITVVATTESLVKRSIDTIQQEMNAAIGECEISSPVVPTERAIIL